MLTQMNMHARKMKHARQLAREIVFFFEREQVHYAGFSHASLFKTLFDAEDVHTKPQND